MTKRVISSAYEPLLVKVSWKIVAWATTANVAETPVVPLNEDHNESSGDTGGFFPLLNIAHLVKIILTINWMSKVDKIINQDENTFLCLFSNTKYISAIIRPIKEWIQNFDLPTHLLACVRWSFMGKLLLTRPLKLICTAAPRTWRLGVASPTQEVDTKPRDALPWHPYLCPSPLCRVFQCEIGCVFPENNVSLTLLCSHDKCGKMQMCT